MIKFINIKKLALVLLTILPLSANAQNSASCGGLGEPSCQTCLKPATTFFPYGFCCLAVPTGCEQTKYSCDAGYEGDRFGNCTAPNLTAAMAISAGCRTDASVQAIIDETLKTATLGDVTKQQIDLFRPRDGWMTTLLVTDPNTWGYRGLKNPTEIESMQAGKLQSKAERRVAKRGPAIWDVSGPEIPYGTANSTSLTLQMIALSSSDTPVSQFLSIALDYKVASEFTSEYVYRFQMTPNSPILGLRGCTIAAGGENQYQVPGKTPITNLARRHVTNSYWELYTDGKWVKEVNDELR